MSGLESQGLHPNAQLIETLYDARARGDRAAVRAMFDPNIVWHDPYPVAIFVERRRSLGTYSIGRAS